MPRETIGARIRLRRERLGLTQQQLASLITERRDAAGDGVTYQGDVSHWEGDRSTPSTSTLVPLAESLNVSVDWLLGREGAETDDPRSIEAGEAA